MFRSKQKLLSTSSRKNSREKLHSDIIIRNIYKRLESAMTQTQFINAIEDDKQLNNDPVFHNILNYLRDYILNKQDELNLMTPDRRPSILYFTPKREEMLEMIGIKGMTDKSTLEVSSTIYSLLEDYKPKLKCTKVFTFGVDFESKHFVWFRIKCDVIGGGF